MNRVTWAVLKHMCAYSLSLVGFGLHLWCRPAPQRPPAIRNGIPQVKVDAITALAQTLFVPPEHLMAVIAFETDGSFDHRFRNPVNETFGLIQFTPELARRLGTSMEDLGKASFEQ